MQRTIPVKQARSEAGHRWMTRRRLLLLVGITLLLLIAAFIAWILYDVSQLPPNFGG
jgi:membrane protein YdbS with pleckstrin-like domain